MIKKEMILVLAFFIMLSLVSGFQKGYCLTSEITSINPSSVDADEEFTVGIEIDNCGQELPDIITYEITRHSEDIEIKEPLFSDIGKMGYANSKRFINYHMRTSPEISSGEHFFETKLVYGREGHLVQQEDSFSVIVIRKKPDLAISRIYTNPEIVYNGDKIILVIDVENAGNGEAKDVRVEIEDLDLSGIKLKYLGRIGPDENLPARFVLETKEEGIFEGNIKIKHHFGGEIHELDFPLAVQVFSKEMSRYWIIGIVLIIVLLIYVILRSIFLKLKK